MPAVALRLKARLSLRASCAPELFRRLAGGFKSGCGLFGGHGDCRLDVRQAAARGGRKYRRGGRLFIGELANRHPVMVTKGQVPPHELTSYALEELGDSLFAVLRLVEHALDS